MSAFDFARVVLGLAVAVLVAVVAALPAVKRWEQRFGLSVLTASGFPLLLLGYVFTRFEILSAETLADLQPAYEIGLGWIGFVAGMQLNLRRLDALPPSFLAVTALVSVPPTILAAVACSLTVAAMGVGLGEGLIRDALLLSACAAISAPANLRLLLRSCSTATRELVDAIPRVDQLAALALVGLIAILFRPAGAGLWRLPRSGWFIVTVGLGFLAGMVVYLVIRRAKDRIQELSLLLGGIALVSGAAGYLGLSVVVVGTLGGIVLANAPYPDRARLEATLGQVERTIYLLFLFIIGASWQPMEWQGWALAIVFAASRMYGKVIGARAAVRLYPEEMPPARLLALAILPESAMAIVVIFSAATLHATMPPAGVRWAINAVIIGSVLTEMVVQTLQRREARAAGEETGRVVTHFL
jgi:hypothetical protein